MIKILLVEDDESLGFMLQENLNTDQWQVTWAKDGVRGLSSFRSDSFDICLLDVMMPHRDGYELAAEIRKYDQKVPLVFLTAKNQTQDRIKGFEVGADDYVTKPFSVTELKYRVEAILKRCNPRLDQNKTVQTLSVGQAKLDLDNLLLHIQEQERQLTYKEARVLQLFFQSPNQIITRQEFLEKIWQDDGFFVARSMDVFISRIRKYLKPDDSLQIQNIRGVGYRLIAKN
ncbi:response regulator transcription factor [Reichenbachiella ulvae]|uniref:Response regulator transcription factor n=1 Tax=Reichenbachiella ulvae TaxID=2980104 RepID=A0ABT3CWC0_9BACT|nr:response regulator transcription factor [Reichenbachiella ulvae]MCV9387856.1 response regulator transcription factor [Reichenbachiella ulvae]